jgi:type IV secretory pathway TrbF-like protein
MNLGDKIKRLVSKKQPANGDQRRNDQPMEGGRRQGESQNPYLSARRTWNDQSAANVASRQMFQLLGVLALLVALAAVAGMTYIGSQSKFVPYVVKVDKLGEQAAVGPARVATAADPAVIHSSVASWLSNMRMVTPDIALQRKGVFHVYSMLAPNDPATAKANEWLNGSETSNPFKRAEIETVSVEIDTVLPQTPDTWQVDWTETTRDRQGALKGVPQQWRALVTVYTVAPSSDTTEQQIRDNPLGIHVRDYSWSKQR